MREFWLEFSEEGSGDKIFTDPPPYEAIHVIEKGAHDRLVRIIVEAIEELSNIEYRLLMGKQGPTMADLRDTLRTAIGEE